MAYTSRQVCIKERKEPSLGLPAAPKPWLFGFWGLGLYTSGNVLPIRTAEQQRHKSGYYRVRGGPVGKMSAAQVGGLTEA